MGPSRLVHGGSLDVSRRTRNVGRLAHQHSTLSRANRYAGLTNHLEGAARSGVVVGDEDVTGEGTRPYNGGCGGGAYRVGDDQLGRLRLTGEQRYGVTRPLRSYVDG